MAPNGGGGGALPQCQLSGHPAAAAPPARGRSGLSAATGAKATIRARGSQWPPHGPPGD